MFLIISCPCALVISIPLSFFGGIGTAAKHGILIKGSSYLDTLNQISAVAFDKTGTLTQGSFTVTKVVADKIGKDKLLAYAAYAESYSNHPIAASIKNAYGETIDQTLITDYQETAGQGIQAVIMDKPVIIGSSKIMEDNQIPYPEIETSGSVVYVAVDHQYAGYIVIEDAIKHDASETITTLKQLGIKTITMLTGDNPKTAEIIGKQLGIEHVYAQLLPEDKVRIVEELIAQNKKLAFVGDGINDAPVLARADIGIAMGGLGSDAAIEAADIVLMTDELAKLPTGIKIAKYTRKIASQNIALALGVKVLFLILGAFGIANLWEAIFADVGITIIAVINATRILAR